MDSFVSYPIRTLTIEKGYTVIAHFRNGDVKRYDFTDVIKKLKPLKPLAEDYELFKQIHLSPGGYSVIWNDDLDLEAEELWYDGEDIASPFYGLMAFKDAEECWNLKPSALRKAVQYGRFTVGSDVMHFGKQWVITRKAMEREYGPGPKRNDD